MSAALQFRNLTLGYDRHPAVHHLDGTIETGFIPAHMVPDGATEPLRPDDPRAPGVCDYLERLSTQSGFSTRFERGSAARGLSWTLRSSS